MCTKYVCGFGGRCFGGPGQGSWATHVCDRVPELKDYNARERVTFVLLPGSSSPVRGGLPPCRFMSLSNALKSARALRSAKNSAVCKAASFSAKALATNWFMLVLSSLLCRSTALFSERGKRKGNVIVSSPYRFTRDHQFDPEPSRYGTKIPHVECNQRVGSPIDGRFEHHLIARISQLRPPQKVCCHRFRHRHYTIQEYFYLSLAQPCREPVRLVHFLVGYSGCAPYWLKR